MSSKMPVAPHNYHRLKHGYYLLSKAMWAKIHGYLRITHDFLLRINKRTRIKTLKLITFSLALKVFEFCNFCFEMHYIFVAKADRIAKREAFTLKRN